ncbi:hypothetical protein J6A31_05725 [bacterium]|nr:hypothetical protein [bacterium]
MKTNSSDFAVFSLLKTACKTMEIAAKKYLQSINVRYSIGSIAISLNEIENGIDIHYYDLNSNTRCVVTATEKEITEMLDKINAAELINQN